MKILVDADSCPQKARDIIIRCAQRMNLTAIFAANRQIPGVGVPGTVMEICEATEGAADKRITELAEKGDMVITRDILLAQKLIDAGITVINDRGSEYNSENIREKLSLRNFTVGLAENGLSIERIARYGKKEIKNLAASLDRILAKSVKLHFRDTEPASV